MSIKLIAHRGYTACYPENTIIAIEAAIEVGAHFVEVDVQLAADGTPVLFHDRTLDRMCGITGTIADYSLQQIAKFTASDSERFADTFANTPIATLRELAALIRQSPNIQFFIELKRISIKQYGADYVLKQTIRELKDLQHQCALISFNAEILDLAKRQGWRTGIVVEDDAQWKKMGSDLSFNINQKIKQAALNNSLEPIFPTDFLFCDVDGLPLSGDLHLNNTQLAVYEIADPKLALRLAARGVDFVETFSIREMRVAIAK